MTYGEEYVHLRNEGFKIEGGYYNQGCENQRRPKDVVISEMTSKLRDKCWNTMTHDEAIDEILGEIEEKIKSPQMRKKLQRIAIEAINRYIFLTGA